MSTDTGWAAFAALGFSVTDNLRLEGEAAHRSSGFGDRGDITNTTLMLNALFDIPVADSITVSLGAGVGIDWIATDRQVAAPFNAPDNASTLAYQAIAEFSYAFADRVDLTVAYRYLDTSSPENIYADANVIGGPAGGTAIVRVDGMSASTISIGLRFAL
jgi:opacity protein-like surface antigen